MHYRRAFAPGGTFFFTVVTYRRRCLFRSSQNVAVLRAAFHAVQQHRPFDMPAVVVLPDHLHCIWTLPPDDADFATRWRLIKSHFTRHCDPALRIAVDTARAAKRQQALWQHRYWEQQIRTADDFARHVDYIHYNPVKHGLVDAPMAWPFSSFRRFVRDQVYAADWGADEAE